MLLSGEDDCSNKYWPAGALSPPGSLDLKAELWEDRQISLGSAPYTFSFSEFLEEPVTEFLPSF